MDLYDCEVDPGQQVVVTPGATEAIYCAISAVVHAGDEVIVFDPSYDTYEPGVTLNGGVTRHIDLHYPDFAIDWQKVRETKGMMVNWLNGASCHYEHLTPLFFELIDYVKAEGHMGRDWYFPNGWGAECVNVWSHPRFRDYVEEFGFVEYWRKIEAWPPACRPERDSFTCGTQ